MIRRFWVLLLAGFGGIIIWNNNFWIGFPIGVELLILSSLLYDYPISNKGEQK